MNNLVLFNANHLVVFDADEVLRPVRALSILLHVGTLHPLVRLLSHIFLVVLVLLEK